jgi:hypothetical protein
MRKTFGIAVVMGLAASSITAQAQGIPQGAQRGAEEGAAVGGPVGGVVGGAVGGAVGAVGGLLGVDMAPRFREYVIREHRSVFVPRFEPRVGVVLPPEVVFYPVPREFGVAPSYRYAVVNDEVVLVEPRSREVVQVID